VSERLRKINNERADENIRERYARGHRYWSEYRIPGKFPLVRGRRFRVKGDSGYYIFHYAARDNGGDWISCDGPYTKAGLDKANRSRCFDPTEVRNVERTILDIEYTVETPADRANRLGLNEKEEEVVAA